MENVVDISSENFNTEKYVNSLVKGGKERFC